MASPDLRALVPLTLFDRDPEELVARVRSDLVTKLPGLLWRAGTPYAHQTDSLALCVAELVFAINRVPGAVVQVILGTLYDVVRSFGAPPVATATFTTNVAGPLVIPADTVLRLDPGSGPLLFELDAELLIGPGDFTGTVPITALENTTRANGTPAGTELTMRSSIVFVDGVELGAEVTDGADPEDVEAWLTRARQRLARLTETLVQAPQFQAFVVEFPQVARAAAFDKYDGVGANTETDLGHVTVAVAGAGGAALSAPVKAELLLALDEASVHTLTPHVIDATVTNVNVTMNVYRRPGYTDAETIAAVEAALEAYLDPDSWPWSGLVRRFDLIALVEALDEVAFIDPASFVAPAADVALPAVANLARAGVLTIGVAGVGEAA